MKVLCDDECLSYSGGAKISLALSMALSAFGAFVLGVIDGISNPKSCHAR